MVSRILVFFLFFFPQFSLFALDDSVKIFNTSKNKAIVVFLDKITSKKKNYTIEIGKKYNLHSMEVLIKRCVLDGSDGLLKTSAYVQVQESKSKSNDKVYIFNGWMMPGYPSVNPMEHSNYDIWVKNCF
jgi:hypothetical protein